MADNQKIAAFTETFPFPACTVNTEGKVTSVSPKITEVFIYEDIEDNDIFILTGVKYKELLSMEERTTPMIINRNDKFFRILASPETEEEGADLVVYFVDVTLQETLKKKYNDEKPCIVMISVDNFTELISSNSEERRSILTSEIEQTIRQYCSRITASITKVREDKYVAFIENQHCQKAIDNNFSILENVRKIESESDFPVTISIGMGRGGKTFAQIEQYAQEALDLALGRGGDQAVVRTISKNEYYGGRSQAVEKTNKSKPRVVAHALQRLIDEASKVIIMGHKNPDMDSFGAAIGMFKFSALREKETHIVLNYYNETLTEIYEQAKESEVYDFISTEKALNIIDSETLLIVVDTHRPSYVEAPELLKKTANIAVIDHHRRAEDAISGCLIQYIEAYASSASELIAEMLQYVVDKKKGISKFEAEAMLAGLTVDTNSFAVKTGVRTFEAAAWLRRSGADTATVKRLFQMNSQAFMLRAKCVANARFLADGAIAISILEGKHVDAQILDSQAADELLDVKGVKASFVVGTTSTDKTVISARSLGQLNVQLIMEQLGGGGHLTTAGAQVNVAPEEAVEQILEVLLEKGHISPKDLGIEETFQEKEAADAAKEEEGAIARGSEALVKSAAETLAKLNDEEVAAITEELKQHSNRDELIRKAAETEKLNK